MMHTKNSIKRRNSPAVDRAPDGLLPSSVHSNIPSLRPLQRCRTCALSEFTSDCVFFPTNTRVFLSSLEYLNYFNGEKRRDFNALDRT